MSKSGNKSTLEMNVFSFSDNHWDDTKDVIELRKEVNFFGTKAPINEEILISKNFNVDGGKRRDHLTDNYKKIISREVGAESINVPKYLYKFTAISPNILPSSTYQRILFDEFPKKSKTECIKAIKQISNIEKSIIQHGYDQDYPIVLRYLTQKNEVQKIRVIGGNHRLQAVRNLIGARKLDKSFKIPCLLVIPMMKKILFICREGKNRSVTAAKLCQSNYNTKSLGLVSKLFVNPKLEESLDWADMIITMEQWHADTIRSYFPTMKKEIKVLNIPDNFMCEDPDLIEILKEKLDFLK